MDRFQSPEFRAAVYGVFVAVSVVAAVAGVLTDEMIAAILGVVSSLITLMALLHTPTAKRVARQEAKDSGDGG